MNASVTASPDQVLRRHRWRARGTLLVWAAAVTLGGIATTLADRLGWISPSARIVLIMTSVAAALLVAWFVRVRRLTSTQLARELDARWALRARLESTVELTDRDSQWAAPVREDAARSIGGRKLPGAALWFGAIAGLSAAFVALTAEGIALMPPLFASKLAIAPAAATPTAEANAPATIEWKTPAPEIKAGAIDEVQLTASADSTAGFRVLSVEATINGGSPHLQPIEAAQLEALAKPGAHDLAASLFLDELNVKPFDFVSYRLVGEINGSGPNRTVASLPQYVEIRPPRRDVDLHGAASQFPPLLFELKSRQLQLAKQNAMLGKLHANASADPTWAAENARVAAEQAALAKRTDEVLALTPAQAPPLVNRNLSAARGAMEAARDAIAAGRNDAATSPQNHALALITELQQLIGQAADGGSSGASDPIADELAYRLPERNETAAGKLEQLANRADAAAAKLAAPSPSSGANAGDASEQTGIATAAAAMGADGAYAPEVAQSLATAHDAALEAAHQLSGNDREAAQVPAAQAQRALRQAVQAQEQAGRANAISTLEAARRTLNDAARTSQSTAAPALAAIRSTLLQEAQSQQKFGSAQAAEELVQIAQHMGSDPNGGSSAHGSASAAAHAQVLLSPPATAVTRVVRQLQRANSTGAAEALASLQLAAQEARWLTAETAIAQLADEVATLADDAQRGPAPSSETAAKLHEQADALRLALERGHAAPSAIVRQFNPADVDPLYRAAVDRYFERLSRDARRPAAASATSATP